MYSIGDLRNSLKRESVLNGFGIGGRQKLNAVVTVQNHLSFRVHVDEMVGCIKGTLGKPAELNEVSQAELFCYSPDGDLDIGLDISGQCTRDKRAIGEVVQPEAARNHEAHQSHR